MYREIRDVSLNQAIGTLCTYNCLYMINFHNVHRQRYGWSSSCKKAIDSNHSHCCSERQRVQPCGSHPISRKLLVQSPHVFHHLFFLYFYFCSMYYPFCVLTLSFFLWYLERQHQVSPSAPSGSSCHQEAAIRLLGQQTRNILPLDAICLPACLAVRVYISCMAHGEHCWLEIACSERCDGCCDVLCNGHSELNGVNFSS